MTDLIADGWARVEAEVHARELPAFKHYRPFATAVEDFTDEAREGNRIFLGIDAFDRQMRGIGRKHLMLLNGYAHSGKTLLTYHILRNNKMKRIALFTPDESAAMVLANLASMQSGVAATELERRIQEDDAEARALLRQVATDEFPNLAVFEEPLTPSYLEEGLDEAEEAWEGEKHDLVIIDYVGLLQAGEDMRGRFDYIKSLSKRRGPVIALHQTSRSAGAEGREMTISSGEFGGEAYATFVLGVRRKLYESMAELRDLKVRARGTGKYAAYALDRIPEVEDDIRINEHTVTVNAVKVKRVGGRLVEELDFEIDHGTGRLSPLGETELPRQYMAAQRRRFGSRRVAGPAWEQQEF